MLRVTEIALTYSLFVAQLFPLQIFTYSAKDGKVRGKTTYVTAVTIKTERLLNDSYIVSCDYVAVSTSYTCTDIWG